MAGQSEACIQVTRSASTNQRIVSKSHDQPQPIRGQHSSHVIGLSQSQCEQCPGQQCCADHDDGPGTPGEAGGGAGVQQEVPHCVPGPVIGLGGQTQQLGEHLEYNNIGFNETRRSIVGSVCPTKYDIES